MLPKEKLPEVVAEVDRLWQERRDALDPTEARAVLAEVGLPPELYEEALEQIRRREAARTAKRRLFAIAAAVAVACALVVGGVFLARARTSHAHGAIEVARTELADERTQGSDITTARRETPLRFDAELTHAPPGEELALACDWVAPSGRVAHHNAWKTKPIDHDPWSTHCRFTVPASSEVGRWKVRMTADGRELAAREINIE